MTDITEIEDDLKKEIVEYRDAIAYIEGRLVTARGEVGRLERQRAEYESGLAERLRRLVALKCSWGPNGK